MRFPRRRHRKLDAQVAEARAQAESAQEELEISRERYQSAREDVVKPLQRARSRNNFADLIRQTIIDARNGSLCSPYLSSRLQS